MALKIIGIAAIAASIGCGPSLSNQERLEKRIEALKKYIPPGLIRLPKL